MKTKNIMIVGVGGQGTLLTSRILGGVILEQGFDVKISEIHGMSQRGGSVVTFVRYGDKVYEPVVEEGQADIILAFERLEAVRYQHFLKDEGVLIVNDTRIDPVPVLIGARDYAEDKVQALRKRDRTIFIDALSESLKLDNPRVFNVVILGLLSNYMDIDQDIWLDQVRKEVPGHTIDVNLAAFDLGRNFKVESNT